MTTIVTSLRETLIIREAVKLQALAPSPFADFGRLKCCTPGIKSNFPGWDLHKLSNLPGLPIPLILNIYYNFGYSPFPMKVIDNKND